MERNLGELAPNRRGRRRGTALVAAVSGDFHSLPTSMAAVTLTTDRATSTAAVLRAAGTPTVVGGPGRTLDDLIELARQASHEHRRSTPPRRGRHNPVGESI